jgi:outer membrane receptor protein involved in Fe transport
VTSSRVPDASFRDVGVFVQDEYNITPRVRLVAGVRLDRYTVSTKATPAYEIESLIAGATPAIDPSTLPDLGGSRLGRTALTGDIGVVFRANDAVSLLARYGRSYRHANLEELLFSGSATVGYIIPNMSVKPETGNNIDLGLKVRSPRYAASLAYFNNAYDGFISTEIVSQATAGPLSRAINFSDVRIQDVEADGELPLRFSRGLVTLFGNVAFTRGDVLRGTNPHGRLARQHAVRQHLATQEHARRAAQRRVTGSGSAYGARLRKVERVAPTLIDSPYLIAQDLLSLDGFAIQRLAIGADLTPLGNRLGVVVAVENLGDTYYREQFQFAPARGRTVTLALRVRN